MNKRIILKTIVLFFAFFIISQCGNMVSAVTDQFMYNIRNRNSGKYLNVNYGTDANGTNVNQFTFDGSYEQKFAVKYSGTKDAFKLYAYCSDQGFSRVVDVYRPLQNGANVDIWADGDDDAQYWNIDDLGNGYYSIRLTSNPNLALTAYGTSNGGGSGTTPTSAGNVFVSTYTGATNQQWSFEDTPVLLSWDLVSSNGLLYWFGNTKYGVEMNQGADVWNDHDITIFNLFDVNYDVVMVTDYSNTETDVMGTTYAEGTISFNTAKMDNLSQAGRVNVCAHELGHALGMGHRRELDAIMYRYNTTNIYPSSMDLWNYDRAAARY